MTLSNRRSRIFGGKLNVADDVWAYFGKCNTYVEPFFGSGAVCLNNPYFELMDSIVVNDLDHYIANFFRALQNAPNEVAYFADYPSIETDLHVRHAWLVNEGRERIAACEWDENHYDAQVAGWWVWGMANYIGSGFCSGEGPWTREHLKAAHELGTYDVRKINRQLPHLSSGKGINRKLPHLGDSGKGINRKLPHLGDSGKGINRQLPHLSNSGKGINRKLGARTFADGELFPRNEGLYEYLRQLAARLVKVRVCCGDWKRVVQPAVTWAGEDNTSQSTCAVFLDPPYSAGSNRDRIYSRDSFDVAHEVRAWCIENESNPLLKIALCGYQGEGHDELAERGWEVFRWKANGGYSTFSQREQSKVNRGRETIWFSPSCKKRAQRELF